MAATLCTSARLAGLSITETTDILGFSETTISRDCREWTDKEKRKYLVSSRSLFENVMFMLKSTFKM